MSVKINIYNQTAKVETEKNLDKEIFALKPNLALIHQAMLAQLANERQVLAHTKDRSEVRGGGKKPWRQKGTGRARVGSSRSPLWIGGGVTFGPRKDRNFSQKINKKMRQKAFLMVLGDKVSQQALIALKDLNWDVYKTKEFNNLITLFEKDILKNTKRNLLIINDSKNEKLKYSARNLVGVKIINIENLNIIDLLKYRYLMLTEKTLDTLAKRYNVK
jgi:large subunit ribosomal protein L4